MSRGRPATPRRARIRGWSVARRPRFRPNKVTPPSDVTLLTVEAEWEHGQRQTLQLPFATADVGQLTSDLLGAAELLPAGCTDVGHARVPQGGASGVAGNQPPAVGLLQGPPVDTGEPGGGGSPSHGAHHPARPSPDRRGALVELLEQRMARYFDGRPRAQAAFLEPALRRAQVGSIEDLPPKALAGLLNQLQQVDPSRPTAQGEPHAQRPNADDRGATSSS